jgi:HlyD family secretion protein
MIRDTAGQDIPLDQGAANAQRKKLVIGGVAAAVLLLALAAPALTRWSSADRAISGAQLRYATVTRGRFVSDLSVQGRVVAAVSPTLYATTPGTVNLKVVAGAAVKKGQVLATVDAPDLRSEFERELASLRTAENALERARLESRATHLRNTQTADLAKVALDAATRELGRYKQSFDDGVISKQEYERREDTLAEARVRHAHAVQDVQIQDEQLAFDLKSRELDVNRQRLTTNDLKRRVDELTVRAPVDGIVGSIAVTDRTAVNANAALMTVVDLSVFEIELDVPESYADDLAVEMPAEITYAGAMYAGKVTAISPEVRNGQVSGRVRFEGEAPKDLRQSQRVSVRIVMEEKDGVLTVDRGQFLESGGGHVAYVVDGDYARRTPITVGATSIAQVEIAAGLTEGQRIVISSTDPFENAETVSIQN